ncbi:hypothetical protein Acor_71810 [Acrocarpospora corrugata]|uniref:Alcohol dehydrogenase-like N-terminal domain-containing protein n=1 Tax=Acrocarpospora corrugata TaxID=35763 RepID=A0A5M3WDE4_9ACTN|nr:hypothetical protein Acor_71810 [Acrocarpospora corrugata]
MVGVADVPKPAVKENELLVKVHATTVNRTDCALRAAKPFLWRLLTGLIRPRIRILGNEFAGEVAAVGGGVTSFKVGDRVFGYNDGKFGAQAEYMPIPQTGTLALMPEGSTYHGRQEHVRPLQTPAETTRNLHLDGPGPLVAEYPPGPHHPAPGRQEGPVPDPEE